MSSKNKMLSLLKWTHGKDKGSYTVGINTDWIKRFNIEYFKEEKYDPNMEFAVEWRDTKKPPLGGWTCYMAKVIYISTSIKLLEKKLESISGVKSPRPIPQIQDVNVKITDDGKDNVINEINIDNTNEVVSVVVEKVSHIQKELVSTVHQKLTDDQLIKNNIAKKLRFDSDSDDNDTIKNFQDSKLFDNDQQDEELKNDTNITDKHLESVEIYLQKESSRDDKNEINNSKKSHDTDEETVDEEIRLKKNKCTPSSKLSPVLKKKKKFSTENEETNKLESYQSTSKSSKKEIHKKSGVYVTKEKWEDAKRKKNFSTMTGALIEAVFPLEVLLISNYAGGRSKNSMGFQKKPLDRKKLDAIFNAVKKYHGSPPSKSSFSTAVNQRCTTLSSTHRALQKKIILEMEEENTNN